ncbi:transcription factor MYB1R1-like [Malania oleifera]|uniref:transcription factor MYB1R1-like n=1 Tax=Malania oleifera TaxID=397392 RepID=UPI0025AE5734|nr:transcription factor MYB1R1-like [Malania oleifera]
MSRCCSQCGVNGHNSRTCAGAGDGDAGSGAGEIMLFGVRVTVDSMRKSVSLNNLSQYEQPHEASPADPSGTAAAAAGYASADDAVPQSTTARERKRGVPWTEEEHKLFLLGLQKVGKGDWRGISRNFVKTRTPTQVASHAQKYFLRRSNLNRRRRRSSLFDITTDTIIPMEEEHVQPDNSISPPVMWLPENGNTGGFHVVPSFPVTVPVRIENPMENLTLGQVDQMNDSTSPSSSPPKLVRPIPVLPAPSVMLDLNLDQKWPADPTPLALKLSPPADESRPARHSAFHALSGFNNGDSIISVA